jgi:uncharacterized protein
VIRKLTMIGATLLVLSVLLVLGCQTLVRKAMFYPTHDARPSPFTAWMHDGRQLGLAREVESPRNVWLFLHGNGGQAADRLYAMHAFDDADAVFILEYPGYGAREGAPSRKSFDAAAREGYAALRARFPATPVCVVGESIGSGPASVLSREGSPPDKIVLIVPFDSIRKVAGDHVRFLPTSLILMGSWDNVEALRGYPGPVEIFGAENDEVIAVSHAEALAKSVPQARFHRIPGNHGWANGRDVRVRNP